ncbi:MAG: dihydropteridine reductase [Clostridia bacterium]|nr:dihydropteridine reductase [Clostridia bacterium]
MKEQQLAQKLNQKYSEPQNLNTDVETLKLLDKKATRPAKIFAYTFGTVGSLVLGTGMCLAMKVILSSLSFAMPLGIGVGLLGILMVSVNYSIYKKLLAKGKKKYADRILALSEKILDNQQEN